MCSPAHLRSLGSRFYLVRDRRRGVLAAVLICLAGVSVLAQSPPIVAKWRGSTFNWSDPARWDPSGVPNNTAGALYSATIDAAGSNVRLTQDIAIQSLEWSQGSLSRLGTGRFTLTVNDGLILSGTTPKTLNAVSLILGGHSVWTNAGNLSLASAALENRGQLDLGSDADLVGTGSFLNAAGAMVHKQAGSDVTRIGVQPGLPATNHGTVQVSSGTLQWLGSALHHGTFRVAAGSTLRFGSGTHELDGVPSLDLAAGATLSVSDSGATLWLSSVSPLDLAGRMEVRSVGRLRADTPVRVAELLVDSGTLDGTAMMEVTSEFTWGPGTVTGPGTLKLAPGATLTLSPLNASRSLTQRTLQFDNAVDWGGSALSLSDNASLVVRSNFTLKAGALFTVAANESARFRNEGVVAQLHGSSQATTQLGTAAGGAMYFDNLGRVEVATNIVMIPHGGTHSGTFSVGNRATLVFGGREGSDHQFHAGARLELPVADSTLELRAGEYSFDSGQSTPQSGKLQLTQAHLVVHTGTSLVFGQVQASGLGMSVELDGGGFGATGASSLSGTLTGHGQLNGDFTTVNLAMAPGSTGDPVGQLRFKGDLTLGVGTTLAFDLGGTTAGTEFDQVESTGQVALNNARLQVAFVRDFQRSITPTDRFVILRAGKVRAAFANLPNPSVGARLFTEDGYGSFRIDYGDTEVVLTDFRTDLAPTELEVWEPFDYAVSVPPAPTATLANKNGGAGFVAPWLSNAGVTSEFQLATDSLPYPDLLRAGNHLALTAPRSSFSLVQRALQYRLGVTGRTRYVSCLVRPLAPLAPTSFFGLLFVRLAPATGIAPANLFIGKPGGGTTDHFVIEEAGGARQQAAAGAPLVVGQTYLLIVKLEPAVGADRVSLFVDPVVNQPEPATANAVKADFDVGQITALGLNSSGAWELDELRIGSTWASVTRPADFHPPLAIAQIPDATVEEGATLDLTPHLVESVAPRTVQWDLPTAPAGMSIDSNTGRIRWTPPETAGQPVGAAGVPVVVRVRDFPEPSSTATYTFSVAVPERNSAPGLDGTSVGSTEIGPGETYHRELRAVDPDEPGNPVTFTLVEGPPGMTLTSAGGLEWTPPLTQAPGLVHVVVEVEDFNATAIREQQLRGRGFFDLNVVPRADLKLTLSASPSAPLIAGQRGRYELEVRNAGPAAAQAIEVRFASSVPFVPPATGLTITDTSSSQATSPPGLDNDMWVFHLGDLAVGAAATVQMELLFSFSQLYALTWEVRSSTAELRGQDNRVDLGVTVGTLPLDNPESWQFAPVEQEGLTGAEVVMDLDPVDGSPVLAWFNDSLRELRYARRQGLDWEIQTVRGFTAGDGFIQRGGLALQWTPIGPRFAYVIMPAQGRMQIRYAAPQADGTFAEQMVYEPTKPVGSLQFFGVPTTLPILWFTEETRLVQAEKSASSAGGWLAATYALPVGDTVYPRGRPFSIAQGQTTGGLHTGYLVVQHPDRTLDLVEATLPAGELGRYVSITSLPRTHLPLYVSSAYTGGITHLAYTFPDAAFVAPDGDVYRLRIAHAEKTSEPWRRDEPLPTPAGVTGSCTRPVLLIDSQGVPQIVFTCTSQTVDTATLQLPGGADREYRRSWQVARRVNTTWTTEEIYASVDRSFGVSAEELRTPVQQPDDPALAAVADSSGALLVAAHTGWPNENLVFGRLAPRWQVLPVSALTTDFSHRPSLALGARGEPYVTWSEIPETGSFELHSAFLADRGGRAGFLLGPSTNLTGPSPAEGSVFGADYRVHAVISDFAARGELRDLQWTPGATEWSGGSSSLTPRSDIREPELVVFPEGLGAVTSDGEHRPAFFKRSWGSSSWLEMPTNTVSPGGIAPARRSVTVADERAVAGDVFVAYVPARPNGSTAPFEVRVATYHEGQWADELVTTILDTAPPLLDAKWLWHAPLEPGNRGYLYLAITGSPDPESRRPLHVLRRNLNRADAPWEDARLEQVAPDYIRDLRLSGRREALRLGYLSSSGRLYLVSADLALDFERVRRATVERVPIDGAMDEFDLAAQAEGTWFVVAHDRKLDTVGMGPFASFGGNEGAPPIPQSDVPAVSNPFLQLSKDCQCLLTLVASLFVSEPVVFPGSDSRFPFHIPSLSELLLTIASCGNVNPAPSSLHQVTGAIRPNASASPSPSLFHSIRDLMNTTAEGKRLVDLYYQHEAAARAVVWEHPALGMRLAFLLLNFAPHLREWREGRGATAVLTSGMIDELNALWGSFAALGSPELKAALEIERTRFHGFQDFVDKSMNQWATLLAIPSTESTGSVHLLGVQYSGTLVTVVIDAAADRSIRLERTTSLGNGTWSVVSNAVESTEAGQRRVSDPTPLPGAAFYRVAVVSAAAGAVR